MGIELGRISGPLLASNLKRKNAGAGEQNLAFHNTSNTDNILFIDVINSRIGINTDGTTHELTVNDTINTTRLIVDTQATIDDLLFLSNKIQNPSGELVISPSQATDPKIVSNKYGVLNLRISDQLIESITPNGDINLNTNGGKVHFTAESVNLSETLTATGNVTWDGTITFGDSSTDNVVFVADIDSHVIPDINNNFDLGSLSQEWKTLYTESVTATSITTPNLLVNGIDPALTVGNTYYVSINGVDTNSGDHPRATFRTVKQALSVATTGDQILIYPGTYEEEFPLTVPQGVSINGAGLRSVTITPTTETSDLDAFLVNGETTIENLAVSEFNYNSVNDTGYAFRFAPNATITTRSPYIRNCTVITSTANGPAGNGALIDGNSVNPSSTFVSMLFHAVTMLVPNALGVVVTNGARCEWLNSFSYYAETGIKLLTGTEGVGGTGNTRITVSDVNGTVTLGDTFTYYSEDDINTISSGTVVNVDGDVYELNGYVSSLVPIDKVPATEFTGATVSQAFKVFGTGSAYFNGSNFLQTWDSFKYNVSNVDFCIEGWIYPTAFPTTESTIIAHWGTTTSEQAYKISLVAGGGLQVAINTGSILTYNTGVEYLTSESSEILTTELGEAFISETSTLILNNWQHIAFVRISNDIKVFVNGVEKISATLPPGTAINNATGNFSIGYSTGVADHFTGYVDEVRISKNTSRFTTNFTTPTEAYVSDNDTYLLLHCDGAEGSPSFIDESPRRQNIAFTNATATAITSVDYKDFGAEMRSINSANVYGTYGAVADGPDTLGYLVGHNFGFIGTGTDTTNDRGLVLQENEVVELNYGKIYYDSVDHKGDYRIGNIFYVNQETGQVSFSADALDISAQGQIVLEGDSSTTIIEAGYVQTGNIRVHDNNVDSLTGPVNIYAVTNTINLSTDVSVTGNISISDNVEVGGNLIFGNQSTDTITFASRLSQDIVPDDVGGPYRLGALNTRWDTLYATLLDIDNKIEIFDNEISVIAPDTDLTLIAGGTGKIKVTTTDVNVAENLTIGNGLTVNGTTSLQDVGITGDIVHTGAFNQTGSTDITGTFASSNIIIDGASYFEVPNVRIFNNVISNQATDQDLVFTANGTGAVVFDNKLKVLNNTISNVWSGATTDQQKSIILQPNGTGNVVIDSTKSLVVPVGSSATRTLATNGEVRFNNVASVFEGYSTSGLVSFYSVYDSDKNTFIKPETTVGNNDNILHFSINGVEKATIDSTKLTTNTAYFDNVSISGNSITNLNSSTTIIVEPTSGLTNINDISILNGDVTNELDSKLVIESTGEGYVHFAGKGAMIIPMGPREDRRANPEVGEIRNSTTSNGMEVFCGDITQGDEGWIPAIGLQGAASSEEVADILDIWTLILG